MNNKILIYNSGGGLGDSIQLIPIILSLQNSLKNYNFYYLSAHDNHFENKLKDYNIKIKTLNLNLKYFGFRWWHLFAIKKKLTNLNIEKFDLIVDLQSKLRNTLILKRIPHINFYSSTFNFNFCTNKKNYIKTKNLCKMTIENLEKFLNLKINYSPYNLSLISDKFKQEAKKLLPYSNYIGLSVTQGNLYRKKSWPMYNFVELAKKLNDKNKIPVFFIEKENRDLINDIKSKVPQALFPEDDSSISCPALVTALSARLEKAISIDNGVMHMMSLSGVPMIVLFGPTNSKKFAPDQKNVKILDSKVLYNDNEIKRITINDVLKII